MVGVPSTAVLQPVIAALGAPPAAIIDELTSGLVRVTRRAEIYEADGATPFDIINWNARLLDGTVTVDRGRDERRALDLLLENSDGALKLDPYDGFWYDKVIKIFWGIRYYNPLAAGIGWSKWETQIGEFMIDRIDEDRFPNAVKVTGRDYAKKCLLTKLANTLVFPTGNPVEDIIKALAANCGVTKFAMPVTGQNYNSDLTFTRGTERWKVMQQLADTIGYEVFFRPDGALTMRKYPDPTTQPIAWNFNTGGGGTLIDYTRSSDDSRIFNHIIVTGNAQGGDISSVPATMGSNEDDNIATVIFAEAINNDPGSPTRVSRIGDRVLPLESDLFTTVEAAQAYANTMLRINALEEFDMNFESLIIPWLEVSDIVQITEDKVSASEYVPTRFMLDSFSLPLKLGSMSGTAKRVTIVGTTSALDYE